MCALHVLDADGNDEISDDDVDCDGEEAKLVEGFFPFILCVRRHGLDQMWCAGESVLYWQKQRYEKR